MQNASVVFLSKENTQLPRNKIEVLIKIPRRTKNYSNKDNNVIYMKNLQKQKPCLKYVVTDDITLAGMISSYGSCNE